MGEFDEKTIYRFGNFYIDAGICGVQAKTTDRHTAKCYH